MWEAMEQTRHHGLGPEVKRRIMLGAYALSAGYYDAYYLKAQQARTLIRRDFDRVFQQVDALVTPTSPVVAFRLGEKINDPVEMYLIDVCTLPVNIAGLPAISLPCGFSEGLPVGLQLIGPHLSEKRLLSIAHAYEQATEWHRKKPEME
jgi:aspartyl-tRNA(Asn)/glutamyl-tRNA(Gln) amidotransferase subunit A